MTKTNWGEFLRLQFWAAVALVEKVGVLIDGSRVFGASQQATAILDHLGSSLEPAIKKKKD